MEEIIRLELFSVQEVKHWLTTGNSERGLSDAVIAKQRAYAIVDNPYATDDLKIISALFVNDKVVAYTYLFPDKIRIQDNAGEFYERLIYWNTALYCDPQYEGRGYAFIVIGQFCELYGEDYFDLDAAEASVENLKFAGLTVEYIQQYVLSNKIIRGNNFISKLARLKERITLRRNSKKNKLIREIHSSCYKLEYVSYIDDEVYQFIVQHSRDNLFIRSQEMLNWILNSHFMQPCPLLHRVQKDNVFTSNRNFFAFYGVKVMVNNNLVGFYIFSDSNEIWYLNYLYYNEMYEKDVFNSIAEHIFHSKRPKVYTCSNKLWSYLKSFNLYSKAFIFNKSFAYPSSFEYNKSKHIQAGDGDNIT